LRHELKTILIVVSATLAALFVHHALDQAQASAASGSALVALYESRSPVFSD
jgi:hypothetical protein